MTEINVERFSREATALLEQSQREKILVSRRGKPLVLFLVFLPEFDKQPQTHGDTYEEATKYAQEVMELLTDSYREEGWPLPKPLTYGAAKKAKRPKTRRVKSA